MSVKTTNKLVAVAGGKGGVGKTVCTANLALGVAARNRALAVDLDIGCGNLNTCLGVKLPARNINDFITRRVPSLSDVILSTPLETLDLISCSYHGSELISLNRAQKQRILEDLRYGNVDYTFIDLGAGINSDILDFFAAADMKILVTSPESLAMHNAFMFVKSLVYRTLAIEFEKEFFTPQIRKILRELLFSNGEMNIGQIIDRFRSWNRYSAYIVQGLIDDLKVHVIMNMVNHENEEAYLMNFYKLAKKYLSLDLILLGLVPFDPHVKKSIKETVPFVLEYRRSPAATAFEEISLRIEENFAAN